MPPPLLKKKKVKKWGKASKKAGVVVDGMCVSEMSREQLEPFVLRVQKELEREREERNYYQLENDKIRTFWEITRQQLEEYRALVRNKDKEIEKIEEKYEQEIKLYHQKMKHLVYEQHSTLNELKIENMIVLNEREGDHKAALDSVLDDKESTRQEIRRLENAHLDQLRTISEENERSLTKLMEDYEENCKMLYLKYELKLRTLRDQLELRYENDTAAIEKRNADHASSLLENHQLTLTDITEHYSTVVNDSFHLIARLKKELRNIKQEKEDVEKEIKITKKQNKQLVVPLEMSEQHNFQLLKRVSQLERDRQKWKIERDQLRNSGITLKHLRVLYDSLCLSYSAMYEENEKMRTVVVESLLALQKYAIEKSMIVEKKLTVQNLAADEEEDREKRQAEVTLVEMKESSVLMSSTCNKNVEKLLREKNQQISLLTEALSEVVISCNKMLRVCKRKLSLNANDKRNLSLSL